MRAVSGGAPAEAREILAWQIIRPSRGGHLLTSDAEATVRIVTHLPHRVREIENTWFPVAGTTEKMAARIFLPEDAGATPTARYPAILEYLPYRKREFTAIRDTSLHRYFAGHGYVSVRIDMRG